MKHLFYPFVLLLAASVIFTGCRSDDPMPDPDNPIAVNLQANITPATVRVANDQWQANDQVGLFMVEANQPLSNASIVNNNHNVLMTIQGNALTPSRPVLYPMRSNVGFIAYFPFQSSVGSSFTIPVNVGNQSAGLPTEVLFSNNITNQAPTENPVTLNFRYSLAKLEITVTGGANSTLTPADFANMTMSIEEVYTQANLQLANGTFANHSARQTVGLHRTSNTGTSTSFEALVLPVNGEIAFLFNIDGVVFRRAVTVDYVAANLYRLNFALNFPSATLLNAEIIPREVNPPQDIDVDAVPSVNPSVIRAENIVGDDTSDVAIVRTKVWNWYEDTYFTLAEAPFQNNGFELRLKDVPESFLFTLTEGWLISDGIVFSDRNVRINIVEEFSAFDSNDDKKGAFWFGNIIRTGEDYNEVYFANWLYVDRDVTIRGTNKGTGKYGSWEYSADLNLRRGWNIVYIYYNWDRNTGIDIGRITSQKPVGVNFRWEFEEWDWLDVIPDDNVQVERPFYPYFVIEYEDFASFQQILFADDTQGTSAVRFTTTLAPWISSIQGLQGSPSDWVSISPESGGIGTYEISISLEPNLTGAVRGVNILIGSGVGDGGGRVLPIRVMQHYLTRDEYANTRTTRAVGVTGVARVAENRRSIFRR